MKEKNIRNAGLREEIGRRLREERESLKLKPADYCQYGDWSDRTVRSWESGATTPNAEFFAALEPLGLDVNYIITGRRGAGLGRGGLPPVADHEVDGAVRVPLLSATGSMGTGNDLLTEDVLMGDVPISRAWLAQHLPRCRPEALKMIHAYGDSMSGTLSSGDFALVDTDCHTADVDGVYVLMARGQLFIKRVTRRMDGAHQVSSDNPAVRTVELLDGTQSVDLLGRVVFGWNGRRL